MKLQKSIENSIKDPVILKNVIDMILDPKNPDSNKVRKEVIRNISNCIQKDDAFLTTVKGMVIENAEAITNDTVAKCLNESQEYLTNALVTTINLRCEDYFKENQRVITNVLKKTLDECIKDILKTAKQVTDKFEKKLAKLDSNEVLKNKSGECTVSVPDKFKNEVENYVNFLKSKQE